MNSRITNHAARLPSRTPPGIKKGPGSTPRPSNSIKIVPQLATPARVFQLLQRLRLDLADSLAGHPEVPADLLQRAGAAVFQAEAHDKHVPFALGQHVQRLVDLLAQADLVCRLVRS